MQIRSIRRFFLFLTLLWLPLQSATASDTEVLKIAGWDVYGDPDHPNKTIGFRSFEQKSGTTIEFTPLSNLDDILSIAESGEHYDLYLISNEGVQILYDMGLVEPIELEKIPHYQGLHRSHEVLFMDTVRR